MMKKCFSSILLLLLLSHSAIAQNSCPDDLHPHAIDLGLPSGTKWACCDIGADSPNDHGELYAWGEIDTKQNFSVSKYTLFRKNPRSVFDDEGGFVYVGNNIKGTNYDAATQEWGYDWSMPAEYQVRELKEYCKFTGNYSQRYFTGPNGNSIRFNYTSVESNPAEWWTSELGSNKESAICFSIFMQYYVGSSGREYGKLIRPVTNSFDKNVNSRPRQEKLQAREARARRLKEEEEARQRKLKEEAEAKERKRKAEELAQKEFQSDLSKAQQGDMAAQFNVGYAYANGIGVRKNYNEAVEWYKKSANQGNASALNNLGACYEDGNGVRADMDECIHYYKMAAEKGSIKAKDNLKRLNSHPLVRNMNAEDKLHDEGWLIMKVELMSKSLWIESSRYLIGSKSINIEDYVKKYTNYRSHEEFIKMTEKVLIASAQEVLNQYHIKLDSNASKYGRDFELNIYFDKVILDGNHSFDCNLYPKKRSVSFARKDFKVNTKSAVGLFFKELSSNPSATYDLSKFLDVFKSNLKISGKNLAKKIIKITKRKKQKS